MKTFYLTAMLFFSMIVKAFPQTSPRPIRFKNGSFIGNRNLETGKLAKDLFKNAHYHNKYYALIQFDKIPGVEIRKELSDQGVVLFDYVPQNAYMSEIQDMFSIADLKRYNISGAYPVDKKYKISNALISRMNARINTPGNVIA